MNNPAIAIPLAEATKSIANAIQSLGLACSHSPKDDREWNTKIRVGADAVLIYSNKKGAISIKLHEVRNPDLKRCLEAAQLESALHSPPANSRKAIVPDQSASTVRGLIPLPTDGFTAIYTDGSYNEVTQICGWSYSFWIDGKPSFEDFGHCDDPAVTPSRNVTGETIAAIEAIRKAIQAGISKIEIRHDYKGVALWLSEFPNSLLGEKGWSASKEVSLRYVRAARNLIRKSGIQLRFLKVDAHIGEPGNERADQLAKMGAGLIA